jgi:hypothetical protein
MSDCPNVVWAFRQRGLTAAERVVLIYLADKANSVLVCWPGLELISEETELCERTVHKAVHSLAAKRLIRIEAKHRQVNHYHILRQVNDRDPDPKHHYQTANGATKVAEYATKNRAQDMQPRLQDVQPSLQDMQPTESGLGCTPCIPLVAFDDKIDPFLVARRASHLPKKEYPPKNPPSNARDARGRATDPAGFDAFWEIYPRKVGKGAARKAFAAATAKAPPSTLMAALGRATWDPNPRFIPHPSTWLNREQWLDEIDDFDPVLRAVGLTPEDFNPTLQRLLQ